MDETWNASLFAHLPGVSLEAGGPVPLGRGEICHLSFEEWRQLDDEFPFNDRQYENSRPVFYKVRGDLPADPSESYRTVKPWIDQLYYSFLLAEGAPLIPNPAFSVTYIQVEHPGVAGAGPSSFRHIGGFEREWIVFGSKLSYPFTKDDLDEIQRVHRLLEAVTRNGRLQDVEAGLHTLELTARPEFWWDDAGRLNHVNGFVHCMTALEEILLPEGEGARPGTLTETFGRHAAVLTSRSWDQIDQGAREFSDLYRLRSRLIHGQLSLENMDDRNWDRLPVPRQLLRYVLIYVMAYRRVETNSDSFASLLARASEDFQAYQALLRGINEGFQV